MRLEPIHLDDRHWFDRIVLAAYNANRMRAEAERARSEGRTASTRYFEQRARAEEALVRNFADEIINRRQRHGR